MIDDFHLVVYSPHTDSFLSRERRSHSNDNFHSCLSRFFTFHFVSICWLWLNWTWKNTSTICPNLLIFTEKVCFLNLVKDCPRFKPLESTFFTNIYKAQRRLQASTAAACPPYKGRELGSLRKVTEILSSRMETKMNCDYVLSRWHLTILGVNFQHRYQATPICANSISASSLASVDHWRGQ